MRLSPKEIDKLMLHNIGALAQKRYARGLLLNYTESIGLIAGQLLEFIREGKSVADLMDLGKQIIGFADVMPGVAEMIHEVQVEGTFPDGTKLVTVHEPISSEIGDPTLALYGSGLSRSHEQIFVDNSIVATPGESVLQKAPITLNQGRSQINLTVMNRGDRPIQVGSHYPFFEANPALSFDREKSYGKRLNIPAGTAVRFEPGERKEVELVSIAGEEIIYGGNALISGKLNDQNKERAMEKMNALNFNNQS